MKTTSKKCNTQKPPNKLKHLIQSQFYSNNQSTATGTCLGECVKCRASCCMDAGHPGPHFCYLCK